MNIMPFLVIFTFCLPLFIWLIYEFFFGSWGMPTDPKRFSILEKHDLTNNKHYFYPQFKRFGIYHNCYRSWQIAGGDTHYDVVVFSTKEAARKYILSFGKCVEDAELNLIRLDS